MSISGDVTKSVDVAADVFPPGQTALPLAMAITGANVGSYLFSFLLIVLCQRLGCLVLLARLFVHAYTCFSVDILLLSLFCPYHKHVCMFTLQAVWWPLFWAVQVSAHGVPAFVMWSVGLPP